MRSKRIKEKNADHIIRKNNIKILLVQPQFPKTSTETISKEVSNVKIVEFNPLDENIFENLNKFIDSLE